MNHIIRLIDDEILLLSPDDVLQIEQQQQSKTKVKTSQQHLRSWRQHDRRNQFNEKLRRQLPVFSPQQQYEVTFINSLTMFFALIRLRILADQTSHFTVDTELDRDSNQPALIQIEFVPSIKESDKAEKKHVIIFEMFHLPSIKSPIYTQIQWLMDTIFHPSKKLFFWGNGRRELSCFGIYQLFNSIPVQQLNIINVQDRFKLWYNDHYPHDGNCYMFKFNDPTDDPICICSHRPYKRPNETWSLQRAVANVYQEFLDKSLTRNHWKLSLDIRLHKWILTDTQNQERQKLINYIINDCFATTKLVLTIGPTYLFSSSSSPPSISSYLS